MRVEVVTLPVSDVDRSLAFYTERVGFALDEVGEIRHKTPIGAWDGGFAAGLDPDRGDYASFAHFADPDGNTWVLQEHGFNHT